MEIHDDSPQVIAYPPLIYLSGLVLGIAMHFIDPMTFISEKLTLPLGVAALLLSWFLVIRAMRSLMDAHTNVDPRQPTTALVTSGPYAFSRNPIYLSMALFAVGIGILANELWIILTLIPVLGIIHIGVILREEKYLTKKFGEEYARYKARVRRWM